MIYNLSTFQSDSVENVLFPFGRGTNLVAVMFRFDLIIAGIFNFQGVLTVARPMSILGRLRRSGGWL